MQVLQFLESFNRAAKQVGLSYKGAWEILERQQSFATATGNDYNRR
ncbi:hypothetical protein [Methylotuvimicrobium sp. KM1]